MSFQLRLATTRITALFADQGDSHFGNYPYSLEGLGFWALCLGSGKGFRVEGYGIAELRVSLTTSLTKNPTNEQ